MFLLPWIGNSYDAGINGEKILIFGESHYDDEPFGDETKDSVYTREVVFKILKNRQDVRFFRVIGELFNSDWTKIWEQVAFANLIQFGLKKGDQPTAEKIASITSFYKYLDILKPDKAIVCSSRAWLDWFKKHIDNVEGIELDQSYRLGKSFVFEYPRSGGKTKVIGINHSSSRETGYNDTWRPVVEEFLYHRR